jgi:hypothetical protein
MVRFIVNQDRDHRVPFNGELHTVPVAYDGVIMGINLYTGTHFLGTFDSVAEALHEMNRIRRCPWSTYKVRGYAKWEVWEQIKQGMR